MMKFRWTLSETVVEGWKSVDWSGDEQSMMHIL